MLKQLRSSTIILLLLGTCISLPACSSTDQPSLGDHFPQIINTPNAYIDIPALKGKLVLENNCLRLNYIYGGSFLLIWDPRFSTRIESGVIRVIDSETGDVLASVGDYIEMGNNGDYVPPGPPTKKPIPTECIGPYIVVGRFVRKIDYP